MEQSLEQHSTDKLTFGFWLYLLTDLIMFATLFATYAVLREATHGGPGGEELFSLPFVLVESLILLTSSFTSGLMLLATHRSDKKKTILWLGVTALLGAVFLAMELYEFNKLIAEGYGPQKNAFLSAFFTLVGTHGLHIASGLLWAGVTFAMLLKKGFTEKVVSHLSRFAMFWHFLDIVWIFIFTLVYLYAHI